MLTVSTGPSTDTMRDLVNYMEQNARTILSNLGLKLNVERLEEPSDVISAGTVLRTIPAAGEPLTAGQTVILVVSAGENVSYVPMPDLIDMDIYDARSLLDELDLLCRVTYVDSKEEEGTIIYQSKNPSDDVAVGTTITLQVSTGPKDENEDEEEEDSEPTGDPKTIWIPKPDDHGTADVLVLLDGEVLYEFSVDLDTLPENGIAISPDVGGIHELETYIDEELWIAMTYDFDAGELIER